MKLDQKMIGQLLPYVPKILSVLWCVPAFAAGFLAVVFYCLLWRGTAFIKEDLAPVAGFHVVSLMLLQVLWGRLWSGQSEASAVLQRQRSIDALTKEIKLMSHEPNLD